MHEQSTAKKDSTLAVTPPVQPRMPWRVAAVEVLPKFCLHVRFMDDTNGIVDLAALIQSPNAGIFAALADPSLFALAQVEFGAVTWPGGIDLAPDAMYAEIRKAGTWVLQT